MGIELPSPQGEARISPQNSTERPVLQNGYEQQAGPNSAEVSTTERPAYQEAKTGQGVGENGGATPTNDANDTSHADSQVTQPASAAPLDSVPVVAADEDLIEKQWVDSAKKVIKDTRNDPYRQSEAISRLQADYLQKRYGKTMPSSGA